MLSVSDVSLQYGKREGIAFMLAGKGTKFVGLMNWFIANTPRFSPRWLTLKITKHLAGRKTS